VRFTNFFMSAKIAFVDARFNVSDGHFFDCLTLGQIACVFGTTMLIFYSIAPVL
jgi:hypothetical protein